jgi:hypothetical protein
VRVRRGAMMRGEEIVMARLRGEEIVMVRRMSSC